MRRQEALANAQPRDFEQENAVEAPGAGRRMAMTFKCSYLPLTNGSAFLQNFDYSILKAMGQLCRGLFCLTRSPSSCRFLTQ